MRQWLRLWPWLAAICTGLLCTGCFAPFNQWWLCWFALTPLLAALWFSGESSRRRGWRDLLLGYIAGLTFFWTVFSWLTTVTALGWFLVAFYMAIYFALWSWLAGALRPRNAETFLFSSRNLALAFVLACAWVAQEYLRSIVFGGWGWNTIGTALHAQWPLIQIAEFTGVFGLSFVVAFANVIALASVRRFASELRAQPMRPHFDLTLTMIGIVALAAFGVHAAQVERASQKLRVALVQANIAREQKFDVNYTQRIFDQFRRLSTPAVESNAKADLVVWPESSTPLPVLEDQPTYDFVTGFAAGARTDLLLGTIDVEAKDAYNAALLVTNDGTRTQLYRKIHLVPFGEYLPGRKWVPFLAQIVDQVPEDFAAGAEHIVFRLTNGMQVAPLICFEDTIGELTRHFVLGGAALLANVTNDGWFLHSAGSQQHLANAVFRCVETRRPLVRAANTGVTCIVNENGRLTNVLLDENGSQFTEGVLTGDVAVPITGELTFYVRHGELFAQLCGIVAALTLGVVAFSRLRRRRRS